MTTTYTLKLELTEEDALAMGRALLRAGDAYLQLHEHDSAYGWNDRAELAERQSTQVIEALLHVEGDRHAVYEAVAEFLRGELSLRHQRRRIEGSS
jgi:hypothetical protein